MAEIDMNPYPYPNPTPLRAVVPIQDVERRRAIHCPEYDACLDTALRHAWASWSCHLCPLFGVAAAPRAADVLYGPIVLPWWPVAWA